MRGRASVAVAAGVVAIGLVAGCGGGGGGQTTTASFTPDELHAIQAATGNVAIFCTNQLVQRSTGRTIAGGPVLADAESGIATLLTLAREKPTALWEPETTTTSTTSTTTSSGTTGTGTTTAPADTTGTGTSTSTTPTPTTGVVTGPRTLAQTLADLEQPVRAGCGQPLLGRLLSAIGQLTGTVTSTSSTAPATTAAQTAPSTTATTQTAPAGTGATTTSTAPAATTQTAPTTAATTTSTAPAATTQTAPAGSAPSAPAVPPPAPSALNGTGPVASEIQISGTTPLVATASYEGSGTFAVRLVPAGGGAAETLFQRVGRYSGQTLLARPRPGRYRVSVDAAGRWSLRLAQPQPSATAAMVPGRFSGTGSRVIAVQAAQALHARVAGSHPAGVSFTVALVSYAGAAPELKLFQKTGPFQGQTVTDIAAGPYLMRVQADGAWSVVFTPAGG